MKLIVVYASTRAGRAGLPVATWFVERATAHGKLDVQFVDLKDIGLPVFDEPKHPRFRQYEHDHTKHWSAVVSAADAFVFVAPEYNYGMPPALLNALDYLYVEWNYKPVGLVTYGGASGGMRSAQMAKMVLTSLKMMPIPEGVALPFFGKSIDDAGVFSPGEAQDKAATVMLDELARWAGALATLRS